MGCKGSFFDEKTSFVEDILCFIEKYLGLMGIKTPLIPITGC